MEQATSIKSIGIELSHHGRPSMMAQFDFKQNLRVTWQRHKSYATALTPQPDWSAKQVKYRCASRETNRGTENSGDQILNLHAESLRLQGDATQRCDDVA